MPDERFQLITPATCDDYPRLVAPIEKTSWPNFMLQDPIGERYWPYLFSRFPEYQFGLMDTQTDKVVAVGNSLPLHWDGDPADLPECGWNWAIEQAMTDHQQGLQARTQCAVMFAILPEYRNLGLSSRMVQIMCELGASKGFKRLIVQIRPNQKSQYPLTSIDDYIKWQNDAGLPFDGWLRIHVRLGAKISKICHKAMTIRGTVAEWESWTGMNFPKSGAYIVRDALCPVQVDVATDEVVYIEPGIWTVHHLK